MRNRYMERCSISLIIREMQIKTKMRYDLTPVKMAVIKKIRNIKCWQGCGTNGTLVNSSWECKLMQPLCKKVWRCLKIKNRTTIWLSNPAYVYLSKENKDTRYVHPHVHCSIIYNSQDMEATQVFKNGWMGKENVIHVRTHTRAHAHTHTGILLCHRK